LSNTALNYINFPVKVITNTRIAHIRKRVPHVHTHHTHTDTHTHTHTHTHYTHYTHTHTHTHTRTHTHTHIYTHTHTHTHTQVIGRCSKLIPSMLIGVLLLGKHYIWQ
jgi:hypothetical protein